jgi:hypothetical protein
MGNPAVGWLLCGAALLISPARSESPDAPANPEMAGLAELSRETGARRSWCSTASPYRRARAATASRTCDWREAGLLSCPITSHSHTLTELHDSGNGVMTPYVVSRSTRQKVSS